jgi:hypothetical protein
MGTKRILSKSIEIIVFIFAAFGGFLKNIAPPEEANARYAVGISSIMALCMLLFIRALSKDQPKQQFRKKWLWAAGILFGVAVIAAFAYLWNIDRLTFPFPPGNRTAEYVAGTKLTKPAEDYMKEHLMTTKSVLVDQFGGLANRELVWTVFSIRCAKILLTMNYVSLILAMSAMIFCLTEGILVEPKSK